MRIGPKQLNQTHYFYYWKAEACRPKLYQAVVAQTVPVSKIG